MLGGYAVNRAPERFGAVGQWASRWTTPADSDRDGLPNEVERGGWQSAVGLVRTDPMKADTDGDALTDAKEADEGVDPLNRDTDGDRLQDGLEVDVLGTDASAEDSDGDGFADGYEYDNLDARGLSPLQFDVKVGRWEYASDFAKGAVLGDLNREDSLAWLAGNLASGGSSLLPGPGWVLGGLADARDAVGSAVRADWVSSGFSAAGVLPIAGDAAAIPGKTAAFVGRNPELAAAVAAAVLSLKAVPGRYRLEAVKHIWPTSWDDLRRAGAGDKALLQMAGGRADLDALAVALRRAGHVSAAPSKFFADGPQGEEYLHGVLRTRGAEVSTQVVESTKSCVEVCNVTWRRFDVVADGVAHEAKVGYKILTAALERQIRSDAYLVKTGRIDRAHWDFLPSAYSGQVGADAKVLDLLDEVGIKYTIHLPA